MRVLDGHITHAVTPIQRAAHTGRPGDAGIHAIPIAMSILIRTGGSSEAAYEK
ncbi:MAG: hypothetical protein HND42_08530 [Armatimonadetes bacterium]|nr:hypothetical protein [Armatimonadota bacterium]